MSSESLPASELSVVDDTVPLVELDVAPVVFVVVDAVVDVAPELPPLVVRAELVPVDPSTEVETEPLTGVVVNDEAPSVGVHAISDVATRLAKSRHGEIEGTRLFTLAPS